MYCKNCKWKSLEPHFPHRQICNNPNIHEDTGHQPGDDLSDDLIYSYSEGGIFIVGDFFGCVHFEEIYNHEND